MTALLAWSGGITGGGMSCQLYGRRPVFKITSLDSPRPASGDNDQARALFPFGVTEAWSGDLSTGLIKLGERAVAFHGLEDGECGLLSLVRCYEANDRGKLLALFEQATTHSSSFCFSTMIHNRITGLRHPVFCIGDSAGIEQKFSGSIHGVFIFPHMRMDPGHELPGTQLPQ